MGYEINDQFKVLINRMQKFLCLILLSLVCTSDPTLSQHTLPVYGNASIGYYFVKIFVGHPPQEQSVIIDTGSGQLALPCNKCTSCNPNHIDEPFDMSKSKTAEYVTCESHSPQCRRCPNKSPTQSCKFMISYAEGSSLEGVIIRDMVQFQSFSEGQQIVTTFGCTTRQTNLFLKQQANGIFGLSPERTSTLLQDLYEKHHDFSGQQLVFSICLAGNGGQMSIGRINNALHINSDSVKTTFSPHRNLYSLNGVGEIKIGPSVIRKKTEKFGTFGIFIDSGATFTYFPRQNYQIFKNQLTESCSQHKQLCQLAQGESTLCFHLKGQNEILQDMQAIFPAVTFEIGGKQVSWKAQKYFLLRDISNRQICLGVESLDRYLLGANWMVDRDIVFDLKNKTIQIFSDSDCFGKQSRRRYMSQYSEQVDGHKPLKYQSGVAAIVKNHQFIIIVGVLLVVFGLSGLLILILRHCEKTNKKKHNAVSTVQTQDHIQLSQTVEYKVSPQG